MRKLEGENVKIEIIDNVIVKISDTKSNFQLNSLKADQYPDIDLSILGEKVILNAEEFKKIVTQTSFAASTKEVRPILTAINAKSDGNSAQFVATDAYRLAKKTCPISSHEFEANIPVKALIEVSKLIEGKEITLNISEKKIVFEFENTKVYSRLLNGDFPKISKMIPSNYPFVLKVNAAKFIDAMQRVSLLSVEKEKIVKMTLDHDNVEILSKNDQVGSANEKIELFEYVGGRFEISFNVDYVSEAIKACLSEDVIISFAGEMNAFSVTPANDNSIIHIITPVRSYY
jgi:DNA polymerase-3 subunit beta